MNVLFWLQLEGWLIHLSFCPIEQFPLLIVPGALSNDHSYKSIFSRRKHLRHKTAEERRVVVAKGLPPQ